MKIVVLGSGNVAQQLLALFQNHPKIELVQWYCRSPKPLQFAKKEIPTIHDITKRLAADLYLLALADNALAEVSKHFKKKEVVVHLAGGMPLNTLKNLGSKGVWYPIQSFTKNRIIDFQGLPFSIEGSDHQTLEKLTKLTHWVGGQATIHSSSQRLTLHLAAVICNNFTNQLFTLTATLCKKHQIEFDLLYPLIKETSNRLNNGNPELWQTGPALRGDTQTIEKHLPLLESPLKEIYNLLTKTIQQHYGKKEL
jgi:predicted short-subunit dehydrogenase-like oxidoreductase (DUF2520 family)